MKVFLSYRRSDVPGHAGRLADTLAQLLGPGSVFQDVTAVAPGEDFTVAVDRALDSCDGALAVIGPGWLAASTAKGEPRLHEPRDFVRLELGRALERNVPVVPVLVGGARLPVESDLPVELRELVRRQGVVLHDETWHQDVEGLVRSLRGEGQVAPRSRRWPPVLTFVAVAVVILGGVIWWATTGGDEPAGDGGLDSASDASGLLAPSEDGWEACPAPTGEEWTSIALADDPAIEVDVDGEALRFTVAEASWRELEAGRWQVTLDTEMDHDHPEDWAHGSWYYDFLVVGRRPFEASCFSAYPAFVAPGTIGDARVGFDVTCEPVGAVELEAGDERGRIVVSEAAEPGRC